MKPRHYIASLLVTVFVIYPFSAGPVMFIDMMTHPKATDSSLDQATFYKPLFFCEQTDSGAGQGIELV